MKKHQMKQRLFLILIFAVTILGISLNILFFFIPELEDWHTALVIISLLIVLFPLKSFKSSFDYHTFSVQKELLFEDISNPMKVRFYQINDALLTNLKNRGYHIYAHESDFTLLYQIKKLSHRRSHTLFMILLIENEQVSFESQVLINKTIELEQYLIKQKYYHRIYLQFKQTTSPTQDKLNQTHNVLWMKRGGQNLSLINTYLFSQTRTAYFVYNKNYSPSYAYSQSIDEIKEIIE